MRYGGRTLAPINPARSAAESEAPWAWRGLSELILFNQSRQPIDIYRRAVGSGSFGGSGTVSALSKTGRELSFDGNGYWSQGSFQPERVSHEKSTITVVIQPYDSNFGVFYGLVDSNSNWIFTLSSNGDASQTVAGSVGVQVRDDSSEMDRGYTPDVGIDDGSPHIVTFRTDALNDIYDIYVDRVKYGITKTSTGNLTTSSGSVNRPYFFGARNLRGSADKHYNGGIQLFMRHGGRLWTDAEIKTLHSDWFSLIRRRRILIPVSSGGEAITDNALITSALASTTAATETASATDTAQITAAIAAAIQSADTGLATDSSAITGVTATTLVAEVGQAVTDTALITAATAAPRTATDTGSATDTPNVTTATATTLQATAQGIVTDAAAIVTVTATPLTAQAGNTITDNALITQIGAATLTANETATATDQAEPTSASVAVRTSAETALALDNATIVNAAGQPIASIETATATDNPDLTVATVTPLTATILPEVLVKELYGDTKIVPVLQGTLDVSYQLRGTLTVKPH